MKINKRPIVFVDIEVSPNCFMIGFMNERGEPRQYTVYDDMRLTRTQTRAIQKIIATKTLITFNGIKYDMPVITAMLEGRDKDEIYEMSVDIIKNNLQSWQTMRNYALEPLMTLDHIDLNDVAEGVFVSLKKYGTRLGTEKLQELPYPYDKTLTSSEFKDICEYNINDLILTTELYNEIKDSIDLRYTMTEEYDVDLRSKSNAQIAEVVISSELEKKGVTVKKPQIPKSVRYVAPSNIKFKTETLQRLLENYQASSFDINPKNGQPIVPDWLKKFPLKIGDTSYKVGVGGLHSQEKSLAVIPNENEVMRNVDVTGYYSSMILGYNFYPKRLTSKFLDVYRKIYEGRNHPVHGAKFKMLALKEIKNRTDEQEKEMKRLSKVEKALKVTTLGAFGKFGSMYSKLYAPDLMLQITISGQLFLLMLIESLEENGFRVVSSNTDGVEVLCPKDREELLEELVFDWELVTGLDMEHGTYKALYARDVNAYIAVYDGYVKAKGIYAKPTLAKDSEYSIVFKAIREHLLNGTSMEETIRGCRNMNEFVLSRVVKYGGYWRGEYLGKLVRYYYSTDGDPIVYTSPKTGTTNNRVAKSDGSKPAMNLFNVLPDDLDFDKYISLAISHLGDLGVEYD